MKRKNKKQHLEEKRLIKNPFVRGMAKGALLVGAMHGIWGLSK